MAEGDAARELGSFRAKFFLAVGSIGWGVKDAGITGLLLLFYSQVIGVSPQLVSLAIGIALIFDAVIDPVIGSTSDNWTSRWGRRLPFMYAAGIPVGLLYFFLWQPPHWSSTGLFFYLLFVAIAVRAFIAMFEIPSSALVPELTTDYAKRTDFLNWRWFLGVLGAGAISFGAFRFLFLPDKLHPVGQLNPAGYPKYALIASVIMTLSILVSCVGLHRYIPYLIKTEPRYASVRQFAREVWATLKIRPFRILVASGLFHGVILGLNGAMGPILLTYFWKLNNKQVALFIIPGAIAVLATFLVLVPLAAKFEKKVAAITCSVTAFFVGSWPYALALFGWTPDIAHHPALLYAIFVVFAVSSSLLLTAAVLGNSMMADVVEHAALQTGRRTEGTFFAASSLIAKSVSGVGIFFSGQILAYAGLRAHADPATLDPQVIHRLFIALVPIQLFLHIGAFLAFIRYPITRKDHEANVARIAALGSSLGSTAEAELALAKEPPAGRAAVAPAE